MKIAISNNHDAFHNLSLEEVLLEHEKDDDILYIYQNANACIFGRNQNILEEINPEYVEDNKIKLVRRISGGGTVYHDLGNINFSFITSNSTQSYAKFLEPIIEFLKSLGLNAEFKGKNDLVVDGFKVSGNAQYKKGDRMFHHGTLLFDADLSVLGKALKPNPLKLASKSIKSARQRVSNIKDLMKDPISNDEFIAKLKDFFITTNNANELDINNYHIKEVQDIMHVRKGNDWIWGKNPEFNINNEKRYEGGTIKFEANIVDNVIEEIKFTGDFLSSNNFETINSYFKGEEFTKQNIVSILDKVDNFTDYFGKLTKDDILNLMIAI